MTPPPDPRLSPLSLAWRGQAANGEPHPDAETLAAFAEGGLSAQGRAACEDHLSRCPACLELFVELGPAPPTANVNAARPAAGRRASRLVQLSLAASVLAAVAGLAGVLQLARTNRALRSDLAGRIEETEETRLALALTHKDQFLSDAPSPARPYWQGNASAERLSLPVARGNPAASPQALDHAARARNELETLAHSATRGTRAVLELAELETAAGNLDLADGWIRRAEELKGGSPDVVNARAVWHAAHRTKASDASAELLLKGLTRDHPDYAPGWFNLALLLQGAFRDDESRRCWEEFLRREVRDPYRRIAEERMAALGP